MTWEFITGAGLAPFAGILVGEARIDLARKLGRHGPRRFYDRRDT